MGATYFAPHKLHVDGTFESRLLVDGVDGDVCHLEAQKQHCLLFCSLLLCAGLCAFRFFMRPK